MARLRSDVGADAASATPSAANAAASARGDGSAKGGACSVLVVGGGLAGLACAGRLAEAGLRVTLVESRNTLGGRAGSFFDPKAGELVDNCQHVSMGCCTFLDHLCGKAGARELFRCVRAVTFLDEDGRRHPFGAGVLPAPFHLTGAFLRLGFLTFPEKLRLAYGLLRLVVDRHGRPGEPFAGWLRRHGQTPRLCARFWSTVLTSALNESPDRIDHRYARQVFVEGFLAGRQAFSVDMPAAPLVQLYDKAIGGWLRAHGVDVRTNTALERLAASPGSPLPAAQLSRGGSCRADKVVLAMPWHRLSGLLDPALDLGLDVTALKEGLGSSPITSVHLWFDRPVMSERALAVVGKTSQWFFRRTDGPADIESPSAVARDGRSATVRPSGGSRRSSSTPSTSGSVADGYLQAVVSCSRELAGRGNEAIKELVLAEVRELLPEARMAALLHGRVVTEHAATYSVTPGVDRHRPGVRTARPDVYLAGDWVRTGWPSTMEGAVRGGYLAARALLRDLGRDDLDWPTAVRPDGLSRWLPLGIGDPWTLI